MRLDFAAKDAGNKPQAKAADRAAKHGDTISPESDTLFVGNMPFTADESAVSDFFNSVASVASLRIPTDQYVSLHTLESFDNQCSNCLLGSLAVLRALLTSPSTPLRMPRTLSTSSTVPTSRVAPSVSTTLSPVTTTAAVASVAAAVVAVAVAVVVSVAAVVAVVASVTAVAVVVAAVADVVVSVAAAVAVASRARRPLSKVVKCSGFPHTLGNVIP